MNYELYLSGLVLFFVFLFGYVTGAYMQLVYMLKKDEENTKK